MRMVLAVASHQIHQINFTVMLYISVEQGSDFDDEEESELENWDDLLSHYYEKPQLTNYTEECKRNILVDIEGECHNYIQMLNFM